MSVSVGRQKRSTSYRANAIPAPPKSWCLSLCPCHSLAALCLSFHCFPRLGGFLETLSCASPTSEKGAAEREGSLGNTVFAVLLADCCDSYVCECVSPRRHIVLEVCHAWCVILLSNHLSGSIQAPRLWTLTRVARLSK